MAIIKSHFGALRIHINNASKMPHASNSQPAPMHMPLRSYVICGKLRNQLSDLHNPFLILRQICLP